MTHEKFCEEVAMVAKDIWAAKVFSMHKVRGPRRFREPREGKPFGFGWYIDEVSISIEVHPLVDKQGVVALQVYGVQPADGRLRLIMTEPV